MNHCRILSSCFICLFIAACDTQEQNTAVEKTTESTETTENKAAPEKIITKKARPALNLSIDNLTIENQTKNDNSFIQEKAPIEKNSALFETLNKGQTEANINLSGELLTDEDKIENKEYLDSVDGVQINIEGNFE